MHGVDVGVGLQQRFLELFIERIVDDPTPQHAVHAVHQPLEHCQRVWQGEPCYNGMVRRAFVLLAFVVLALVLLGTSYKPSLYMRNLTSEAVRIRVGCENFAGEIDKTWSVDLAPGNWTQYSRCGGATFYHFSIEGSSNSSSQLKVRSYGRKTFQSAAFVTLDSTGLHQVDPPTWFKVSREALFYIPELIVLVILCFLIRQIWRGAKLWAAERRQRVG